MMNSRVTPELVAEIIRRAQEDAMFKAACDHDWKVLSRSWFKWHYREMRECQKCGSIETTR